MRPMLAWLLAGAAACAADPVLDAPDGGAADIPGFIRADTDTADAQMNMGTFHRDGTRRGSFDARIRRWNRGTCSRLKKLTGW